ncbi:molybdenum cofactor sulfurase-like [Hibiscus syriacus]|uniref:molybdenum cofactor sulfurase-like n=1 Tax=Hibiscus syriacus TaxID=106335 RepID=UPI001923A33B|nr:molybdenum cofactor sulfurase-like [Hibiscus syriacus]
MLFCHCVVILKLLGYPTELGALIIRNDAVKLLKKTYFSGGTVAASIADIDFVRRREGVEEYFEDNTISFLSIASIRNGFKILNSLTTSAMCRYEKFHFYNIAKFKDCIRIIEFIFYYISYIIANVHMIACFPQLFHDLIIPFVNVFSVSISHA